MSLSLRPMTLGDVLDRTITIYRHNFWLLVGTAAAPMGGLLAVLVVCALLGGGLGVMAGVNQSLTPGMIVAAIVLGILVAFLALGIMIYSYFSLTWLSTQLHLEKPATIRQALKSVSPRFGRYLWLMILQGLIAVGIPAGGAALVWATVFTASALSGASTPGALGIFILVITTIAALVGIVFLMLQYAMALPIAVVEGSSAWQSLRRAGQLSRGTRGRLFVLGLLVSAISMMLSVAAYFPTLLLTGIAVLIFRDGPAMAAILVVAQLMNLALNLVANVLVLPVGFLALSIFYYDQRVRKEGYDIEWLMEQAGLQATEAVEAEGALVADESIEEASTTPSGATEA